jgi:hypothetical protein
MAPGNLRSRLNQLMARASTLPSLPTEAEDRAVRARLNRELDQIRERCPDRVAAHEALSPEERAAKVERVTEALIERLRALGLRP